MWGCGRAACAWSPTAEARSQARRRTPGEWEGGREGLQEEGGLVPQPDPHLLRTKPEQQGTFFLTANLFHNGLGVQFWYFCTTLEHKKNNFACMQSNQL